MQLIELFEYDDMIYVLSDIKERYLMWHIINSKNF